MADLTQSSEPMHAEAFSSQSHALLASGCHLGSATWSEEKGWRAGSDQTLTAAATKSRMPSDVQLRYAKPGSRACRSFRRCSCKSSRSTLVRFSTTCTVYQLPHEKSTRLEEHQEPKAYSLAAALRLSLTAIAWRTLGKHCCGLPRVQQVDSCTPDVCPQDLAQSLDMSSPKGSACHLTCGPR